MYILAPCLLFLYCAHYSKMAQSTYAALLESLRHDDSRTFRAILEAEGLPRNGNQALDYDLLVKSLRLNRKRIVGYLLDKKCRVVQPYSTSIIGTSPLHMAVEKLGWCKIVEKMLNLGARVTDVNALGDTVLHAAFKSQASDYVVDLLMRRYLSETAEDVHDKDGLGFMHIACTRPNVEIVREFFDTGKADMWGQVAWDCDKKYAGYTPLHFAVEHGRHDMAKFLCEYEAEIYQQDSHGSTPVHLALEKRDVKMIDCLLYYDCRHDSYTNNMGLTHFMAACALGDANIIEQYLHVAENSRSSVRSLLNSRVKDIPGYEFAGYASLHFAAEFGHFNIVKGLLQIGAQHLAVTTEGFTAYALADRQQHREVCWLFQQWFEFVEAQARAQVDVSYVNVECNSMKECGMLA